jgi:hypothetical protein
MSPTCGFSSNAMTTVCSYAGSPNCSNLKEAKSQTIPSRVDFLVVIKIGIYPFNVRPPSYKLV